MYFPGSRYTALTNEQAQQLYPGYPAANYAGGGPVEQMSNANAIGANTGFPQANLHTPAYSTPYQMPMSQNVVTGPSDTRVDPFTGEERMATGGISDAHYNLGGYSEGEFVVPARIVSEIGNGSTEAGARKLYAMMDRVQAARRKTVGKNKVAHNTRADKYLPA
jgi:hypothetical protein